MSEKDLAIEVLLPAEVNTFEYTKNHHFLRFKRKTGEETKIVPHDMVLYFCDACQFEMLTESNHGPLPCPVCKTGSMKSRWMKKQTCFVPEKESDFDWPQHIEEKPTGSKS
jgi:hypothetical protein